MDKEMFKYIFTKHVRPISDMRRHTEMLKRINGGRQKIVPVNTDLSYRERKGLRLPILNGSK